MMPGLVTANYCFIIINRSVNHHVDVEVVHDPQGTHDHDGDDEHGKSSATRFQRSSDEVFMCRK